MSANRSSLQSYPTRKAERLPWKQAIVQYGDALTRIVDSQNMNPTHLPGWLDITIRSHRLPDPVEFVTLIENDRLCAAIPVFYLDNRHYGVPFDTVELVTNSVSYHADLITTIENSAALDCFFDVLHRWHIFHAGNLMLDGSAMNSIQRYADANDLNTMILPAEDSPYLPIESDWDSFIATKNKKFRYKVRQRQKTLATNSHISAVTLDSNSFADSFSEEILDVDSQSWKAKHGLDIRSRSKEKDYYLRLLPYLAELGVLHIDMLYYDKTPIAYSLCVNHNGWFGQLKTSFDERFSELSPGAIVIDKSIKAAFDSSAREFDFLGDMDRHKRNWTEHVRQHADIFVFNRRARSRALYFAREYKNRLFPQSRVAATKKGSSS